LEIHVRPLLFLLRDAFCQKRRGVSRKTETSGRSRNKDRKNPFDARRTEALWRACLDFAIPAARWQQSTRHSCAHKGAAGMAKTPVMRSTQRWRLAFICINSCNQSAADFPKRNCESTGAFSAPLDIGKRLRKSSELF